MAIWKQLTRRGEVRWRARQVGLDGRPTGKTFRTREEAEQWTAKFRQEKAQARLAQQPDRNCTGQIDSDFIASTQQKRTVGAMLLKAMELDWADSKKQQERGVRACRMIGFNTPIEEVTTETLDQVVSALRVEGRSVATIKIYLAALSVVLKRARRLNVIYELPLMPESRTLKRAEPRDLVIQQDWFDYFLSCFKRDNYQLLTAFIWHTGCRVSEAQNLNWERINFTNRRVQFVKTKVSMPRTLPMSDAVEAILLKCRQTRGTKSPFRREYTGFQSYYKERVRMTCRHFGLSEQIYKEWTIHTLRHTKLTRLANAGANAIQIKEWAGHHNLAVSQRYIHSSGIDLERLISVERGQASPTWDIEGQFTH